MGANVERACEVRMPGSIDTTGHAADIHIIQLASGASELQSMTIGAILIRHEPRHLIQEKVVTLHYYGNKMKSFNIEPNSEKNRNLI